MGESFKMKEHAAVSGTMKTAMDYFHY